MARVGENIRSKRKEMGLSGRKFAEKAHISPSFLSDIELGKTEPSMDTLRKIAFALDCPVAELLAENTENRVGTIKHKQALQEPASHYDMKLTRQEDWVILPILAPASIARVSYGGTGMNDVYREASRTVKLPIDYIGTISTDPGRQPFVIIVRGDSMEEAHIPDGAEVVINPAEEIRDGDPALVCYGPNGDWAIKWVYWHRDNTVELRAASLKYPPKTFTREDIDLGHFRPIGKVVKVTVNPKRGG